MHGWLDRPAIDAILDTTDVMLLPSNFEGMPLVAMEALSKGCAVVASRTSGVEDIADNPLAERCFWSYPIGDVAKSVECLQVAARVSPFERREQARRLAEAECSIECCVDRYCSLLRDLPTSIARETPLPAWQAHFSALASYPLSFWRRGRIAAIQAFGNARDAG
jgi:glycosyltransferase involved in cell wall biosynthesis